jgi:hypothetical protein
MIQKTDFSNTPATSAGFFCRFFAEISAFWDKLTHY